MSAGTTSLLVAITAIALTVGMPAALDQGDLESWSQSALVAEDAADGTVDGRVGPAATDGEPIDPTVRARLDSTAGAADGGTEPSDPGSAMTAKEAAPLLGVWRGAYVCYQGRTGMTLVLGRYEDGTVDGVMHFYPTESGSPDVPRGTYVVRATRNGGRVVMTPVIWLERPTDYVMVGLSGFIDKNTGLLTGKMQFDGCTDFALARLPG